MTDTNEHPAAALFPMLNDEELQALADDIATHGLHQPIVRTPDKQILDGRNRLAACKLAGKRPKYVEYDGEPWAYVISANLRRREMNKSQRAVCAAKALPHYTKLAAQRKTSGKKLSKVEKGKATTLAGRDFGISGEYVRQAALVLERMPELIEDVVKGDEKYNDFSLSHAYWLVTELERGAEDKKKKKERQAKFDRREEKKASKRGSEAEAYRKYSDDIDRARLAMMAPANILDQVELGVLSVAEALQTVTSRQDVARWITRSCERLIDDLDGEDLEQVALGITEFGYDSTSVRRVATMLTTIAGMLPT